MPAQRPTEDQLISWLNKDLNNWGRWGPDDEKGTLNHLSTEKTRSAMALVEDGATVSCARNISYDHAPDTPRPPHYFMVRTGFDHKEGEPIERQVAIDYFGLVFHGHSVTHIDSLAHFFWDGKMYNGFPMSDVSTDQGARRNNVLAAHGGIVTRGVLVDAPYLRGTELVERGDGVGMDDIEKAVTQCGVTVEKGDVLLMRTGQLGHREKTGGVDVWSSGSAGPKPEILPFMHEREIAVMGSDTGNDVAPTGYQKFTNPVHQVGIVGMGLWILDNAWLDDLAEECRSRGRWEFAISINPLRIPNATGSPVNPIAIF
ncbi:MAG: cyclase family protein [Chloroflexi bacterium]|nr:cyclase family protein [Chloroflexota bacterium]